MIWFKKIGVNLLLLFLVIPFSYAADIGRFEEKEIDNKWVVSRIEKSTVYATVNGKVTHGDKLRIRFVKGKCDMGNLLTTVYTTSNHPNILQLKNKYITANFMNIKVTALVLFTQPFLAGHISWVDLNFIPKEVLKRELIKENPIKIEFLDSEKITITEYFDITQNSWSNKNLGEAVDKASNVCKEL